MNDIDKIQVATSHMLADWLRQSFTVIGLLCVVLQKDWKLALVSLTRAALRADSDAAHRAAHPAHHAPRAGRHGRVDASAAGGAQRPAGGEVVRRRRARIAAFPRRGAPPAFQQPALCGAAGHRQRRSSNCLALSPSWACSPTRARKSKAGRDDLGEPIHRLRHRPADALRAGETPHRHSQHLPAGPGRVAKGASSIWTAKKL